MTIAEVFRHADEMDPGARQAQWLACGREKHPQTHLPRTDPASGSLQYCDRCWTAFDSKGNALNPPGL